MYTFLIAFVSAYSVFAAMLVIAGWFQKESMRMHLTKALSRIRDNRALVAFEVLSRGVLLSWLALVLPWIDLFGDTGFITRMESRAMVTYLGSFEGQNIDLYFVAIMLNFFGVIVALSLIDTSSAIRKSRKIMERVMVFTYPA